MMILPLVAMIFVRNFYEMFGKKGDDTGKKKKSTLDKVLLGVVIGGAVGSVVGATMSNKEMREKVRSKMSETSGAIKDIVEDHQKEIQQKKSIWHKLHKMFFPKN
ncbi:YtxH domain-containing protein [Candidatus Peregrinibacteria bacterium]|jgi:gas vesicle protein|nr:YtxH domain-containing protein [Candidatus Peregrinibacteria bacterium]